MDSQPLSNPFLTVCIPVYNYDCYSLLRTLNDEIERNELSCDILLGDDGSLPEFHAIYEEWKQQGLCSLFTAQENKGAGVMRNELAKHARGKQLLYLDADTMPIDDNFLQCYIKHASPGAIVVGGFKYPTDKPQRDKQLRYYYGHNVETRSLAKRLKAPYKSFITMAFCIPKAIKLMINFDANPGMGYEDALFGYALEEMGIPIIHINNPVEHELKENNLQFLNTTRKYLDNLYRLQHCFAPKQVAILDAAAFCSRYKLTPLLARLWNKEWVRHTLEHRLSGPSHNLKLFSFYKLLYFCHLKVSCTHNK